MTPRDTQQPDAPEGYMRDAQQRLVPIEHVDEVDQLRDQTVRNLTAAAKELQAAMSKFKNGAMSDIRQFVALSLERYGAKVGGTKGNLTLTSYDGTLQVKVQVSENIRFDERIQAAKALIDECIHNWTAGSSSEVKALVEHAFQSDKEGKISIGRILGLTRLKIDDETWLQAMEAIRDSIQVVDTATYMRLYQRTGPNANWTPISLDIAKL